MKRRLWITALASLPGLAGCAQGQTGGESPLTADVACHCPTSGSTPATDPSATPPCSPSAGPVDPSDGGAASPDASASSASDAGLPADGGIDPTALLALLGSPVRSDPNPVVCPSNFSCQSFDGLPACMAQGALTPPSCQANADCTAAGLPGAPCVTLSIDLAGVASLPLPVCLALCNSG